MRQIETKTSDFITDYLEDLVRVAKAWKQANPSNTDNVDLIACDYGQMYAIQPVDFVTYDIDMDSITSTEWVGPIPNKPPRIS